MRPYAPATFIIARLAESWRLAGHLLRDLGDVVGAPPATSCILEPPPPSFAGLSDFAPCAASQAKRLAGSLPLANSLVWDLDGVGAPLATC